MNIKNDAGIVKLLEAARSIESEDSRAETLREITPHLPENLLPEVLEAARSIESEDYRAIVITSLVPYISSEWLQELLELTRSIEDIEAKENRIQALRDLDQRIEEEGEDARYRRFIAFLTLVRYILFVFGRRVRGKGKNTVPHDSENCYRREKETELIDERFCQAPRARATTLSSLFFLAEGRERTQIFEEMLTAVEEIPNELCKAESLLYLAPYLPTKERKQALAKVPIMIGRLTYDQWFEPVENYASSLPLPLLENLAQYSFRFAQQTSRSWSRNMIPLEPEPVPRYFNTLFTDSKDQIIPADKPLIHNHLYNLAIKMGAKPEGLGEEVKFPDALRDAWTKETKTLPLTVIVASQDFEIIDQEIQILDLPRKGSSESLKFSVKPTLTKGESTVQISLIYRGNLIQSKKITALIVPTAEAEVPDWMQPAQTAKLTFAITSRINPSDLDLLPERVFSIAVGTSIKKNIDLRLLDRTRGDEEIAYYSNTLTETSLGNLIAEARKILLSMITGENNGEQKVRGYEWILDANNQQITDGNNQSLLDYWLLKLAQVGYSLYLELLSPQHHTLESLKANIDGSSRALLQPDDVIQVNPILGSVTIPWALVYERNIIIQPNNNHVCNQFDSHDLNCSGCPNNKDPFTVCPHAFWGYRYSIEQLPCWQTEENLVNPLIRKIKNEKTLEINLNVWQEFNLWENHVKEIQEQNHIEMSISKKVSKLFEVWQTKSSVLDLLYFYCHSTDKDGKSYLELSDSHIDSTAIFAFIDSFKIKWPHYPLIFLNACGTGNYGPDSYASLIKLFLNTGACGVIGTECSVPELFAEDYASELLPHLFAGKALGQAMLEVRREFLYKKKNPLGLIYSLYAAHEVALTHPVNKEVSL